MTYFLLLTAAAVLVALSFVFYHQRKMEREKQLSKEWSPIVPSRTVSTLSTNRISARTSVETSRVSTTAIQNTAVKKSAILVVDDHIFIRRMLSELFVVQGIDVYEAENSGIALELFRKQKLDCVLLDLKLPDSDGIEVLRGIRELSLDVPVILITGYADPAKMEEVEKLGISKCFTKPFDIVELKEVVLCLLEQQSLQAN